MIMGQLPEEGPVQLGPVTLPPGRPIMGAVPGEPVGWATVDPVPGSGRVWAALSELHPQTGLVPVLLGSCLRVGSMFPSDRRGLPDDALRPWDNGEFGEPEDPRGADGVDVAAPPERTPLTRAEFQHGLDVILPRIRVGNGETLEARVGLVAASRAADLLAVIGWGGLEGRGESLLTLTAVLRSWEDRFGARPIDVGHADLRLIATRPPRTLAAAQCAW